MMRIALLGNSHLYSWKGAWNSLGRAYPDVELVFFAAPGEQLECCEPEGDRLVFKREDVARLIKITSGGRRELVPTDYDVFCVVGLGFEMNAVTRLYSRWRADSHTQTEGSFRLVSDACFQDAVDDLLSGSLAMTLVGRLRRITDKVIWLAPGPVPSEIVLTSDQSPWDGRFASAATDAASLGAAYEKASRRLAADDLIVLEQPKATLASPIVSKDKYRRRGGEKLDFFHLNNTYGKIVLRDFLSRLDPSLAGRGAGYSPGGLLRLAASLLGAVRNTLFQMSIRRSPKG